MKRILQSVAAVIAGCVAIAITSFAANFAIGRIVPDFFVPGVSLSNSVVLVLILAYSIAFSGLGGYVTAWLAARSPMSHVIALTIVQLGGGIVAATQAGGALPRWFAVAVVILPAPAILFGGALKTRRNLHP